MKDIAITFKNVSKNYKLYSSSADRAKEALSLSKKKRHKTHSALKNINLEVKKGEILGIVGRNGCGKSTLLKLIAGVLKPSCGDIKVNGHVTALLELGAGFNPEFTGMENIYFYATILGLSEEDIKTKIDDIITFAEIGEYINQPIKTYSSGMRSRLSFAVAIHIDSEILILDEVLSVGDVLFRRKCYAKMEELFTSGKTIIYVSHDANSVRKLCTRAILLHESHIVLEGEPSEVTKYYEQILFSGQVKQNEILRAISLMQGSSTSNETDGKGEILLEYKDPPKLTPSFIPDFKPKTTLNYDTHPLHIISPHFETKDGREINVLVQGESYNFVYDIKCEVDFYDISFNLMIKTLDGVKISGVTLSNDGLCLEHIEAGITARIKWSIDNHLIAGHYMTNVGVMTGKKGNALFIARIVDSNIFKVIGSQNIISGYVNLGQRATVELPGKEAVYF